MILRLEENKVFSLFTNSEWMQLLNGKITENRISLGEKYDV